MRAEILGWFGKDNTGDEAYKAAYPLILPHHELRFITPKMTPSSDADILVLGGGDVVYGEFREAFLRHPAPRKIIASVTLTKSSDRDMLGAAERVIVRDPISATYWGASEVLPDFAFALKGDPMRGWELIRGAFEGRDLYKRVVVFAGSAYLMPVANKLARDKTTAENFVVRVAAALDDADCSVLFLPFSTGAPFDDRAHNALVAAHLKWWRKSAILYTPQPLQNVLDIVAASHAAITCRLHAAIFSVIGGVPFVDVTHHSKNAGFLREVDCTQFSVDYWDFSRRTFDDVLNEHLSGATDTSPLGAYTEAARTKLAKLIL